MNTTTKRILQEETKGTTTIMEYAMLFILWSLDSGVPLKDIYENRRLSNTEMKTWFFDFVEKMGYERVDMIPPVFNAVIKRTGAIIKALTNKSYGDGNEEMIAKVRAYAESNLSKKRLSEQGNLNSQEELDAAVKKSREENEAYRTGTEFNKRLIVMLGQMKSMPNLDTWVTNIKEHGIPSSYYRKEDTVASNSIYRLMGILGGEIPEKLRRVVGSNEFTYLMIETFFANGGYSRDFRVGELKLPSINIYDVGVLLRQRLIETRQSFGNVVGAKSKEEAIKMYKENPMSWEQDSEHSDTDYGDIVDVTNGEVDEEIIIKITPEMLGL
jgi:hypothetical protein